MPCRTQAFLNASVTATVFSLREIAQPTHLRVATSMIEVISGFMARWVFQSATSASNVLPSAT